MHVNLSRIKKSVDRLSIKEQDTRPDTSEFKQNILQRSLSNLAKSPNWRLPVGGSILGYLVLT